jgi:hypothetical protein
VSGRVGLHDQQQLLPGNTRHNVVDACQLLMLTTSTPDALSMPVDNLYVQGPIATAVHGMYHTLQRPGVH